MRNGVAVAVGAIGVPGVPVGVAGPCVGVGVNTAVGGPVTVGLGTPPVSVGVGTPLVTVGVGTPDVTVGVGTPDVTVGVGTPDVTVGVGTPVVAVAVGDAAVFVGVGGAGDSVGDAVAVLVGGTLTTIEPLVQSVPTGSPSLFPAAGLEQVSGNVPAASAAIATMQV